MGITGQLTTLIVTAFSGACAGGRKQGPPPKARAEQHAQGESQTFPVKLKA